MSLELRYLHPAKAWTEALPVGNGKMGAMIFGGITHERLALNEDTLWSGKPRRRTNPSAKEVLPKIRRAIQAERYQEADQIARRFHGPWMESYQPLADLVLMMEHGEGVEDYERRLDLDAALASVTYRHGGTRFHREIFLSHPDHVLVVRLTVGSGARLSGRVRLDSLLPHRTAAQGERTLMLTGQAPEYVEPSYVESTQPLHFGNAREVVQFAVHLEARHRGGTVWIAEDTLHFQGAEEVILFLTAATSFEAFDRALDADRPVRQVGRVLESVRGKSYDRILADHQADHRSLFRRMELALYSENPVASASEPTDERLRKWSQTAEPALAALLFQYGRYLLIASSRPGSQPANLQGLWNSRVRPPWSCNYTLNINLQMNYWLAESCNLAECHQPLLRFVQELAVSGHQTARSDYGMDGWVAHHNSDLWRSTHMVGGQPKWANWPMGGAWLCRHLWEHYEFGGEIDFLRDEAWPVLKEAAGFCLSWLVEDSRGFWVTSPSTSPETEFRLPDGSVAAVSAMTTMDLGILRDLFGSCLRAGMILGRDPDFLQRVEEALKRLPPFPVNERGCLQEWSQDWPAEDVHHRHISHLYAVHPGNVLTWKDTPELMEAAQKALEGRGEEGTGWSLVWKMNAWARFHQAEKSYGFVTRLFTLVQDEGETVSEAGGLYPNLFDAHPPFQIDGNFGFAAGVAEMLVQSHAGRIELLPALPKAWPQGFIRGLRCRGGVEVQMRWNEGRLVEAELKIHRAGVIRIRAGSAIKVLMQGREVAVSDSSGCVEFTSEGGDLFLVKPQEA